MTTQITRVINALTIHSWKERPSTKSIFRQASTYCVRNLADLIRLNFLLVPAQTPQHLTLWRRYLWLHFNLANIFGHLDILFLPSIRTRCQKKDVSQIFLQDWYFFLFHFSFSCSPMVSRSLKKKACPVVNSHYNQTTPKWTLKRHGLLQVETYFWYVKFASCSSRLQSQLEMNAQHQINR